MLGYIDAATACGARTTVGGPRCGLHRRYSNQLRVLLLSVCVPRLCASESLGPALSGGSLMSVPYIVRLQLAFAMMSLPGCAATFYINGALKQYEEKVLAFKNDGPGKRALDVD